MQEVGGARRLAPGAVLVITDSNRRRGVRGGGFHYGYTETAGEKPMVPDPHDQRLENFPGSTDASRTVTVLSGVKSVTATSYGTIFGYSPSQRPVAAIDGNVTTSWYASPQDHDPRIAITLDHPIMTDRLGIAQPTGGDGRYVSNVEIRFDGGRPVTGRLEDPRRVPSGQYVFFRPRRFHRIEVRITGIKSRHGRVRPSLLQSVGFTELALTDATPGAGAVRAAETVRLPHDLVSAFGTETATHPFVVAVTRELTMDEVGMRRAFETATDRAFAAEGTVVFSGRAGDSGTDAFLGLADAAHGGLTATASNRFGDQRRRASYAFDGRADTVWEAPWTARTHPWVRFTTAHPTTVEHLDLVALDDARHARPEQLTLRSGSTTAHIDLGTPRSIDHGIARYSVSIPAVAGRTFTVTVTRASVRHGRSARGAQVAIAEENTNQLRLDAQGRKVIKLHVR